MYGESTWPYGQIAYCLLTQLLVDRYSFRLDKYGADGLGVQR
jgi:hypothetical protein